MRPKKIRPKIVIPTPLVNKIFRYQTHSETPKGPPYKSFRYCETEILSFLYPLYGLLKFSRPTDGQLRLWAVLSLFTLTSRENECLVNSTEGVWTEVLHVYELEYCMVRF